MINKQKLEFWKYELIDELEKFGGNTGCDYPQNFRLYCHS